MTDMEIILLLVLVSSIIFMLNKKSCGCNRERFTPTWGLPGPNDFCKSSLDANSWGKMYGSKSVGWNPVVVQMPKTTAIPPPCYTSIMNP